MKRRFVQKLLTGMTTAAMTVSSLAAPITSMAAPGEDDFGVESSNDEDEDFEDILEDKFEEEAEEEYVEYEDENDTQVPETEEYEDVELVKAGPATIRALHSTVYAIKGGTTTVDIAINSATAESDAQNHTTYALSTTIPMGLSTESLEEDGAYDDETWYEHVINCNKAGTFKVQYGTGGVSPIEVTVIVYEASDVIKIAQTEFTFKQGQAGVKTFTVTPSGNGSYSFDYPNGTDDTYTIDVDLVEGTSSFWFSEDSGQMGNPVALVDADRANSRLKIYIGETGTTSGRIVAYSSSYGYAYMPITITVNPADVNVTGVSLNKSTLDLTVGNTSTLTATVTPSDATDKSVTWSSSNTSVATVNANGVVTAKAAGSALITATTTDGNMTASCAVSVSAAAVSVSSVSLDKTTMSMTTGTVGVLTAAVSPSNATNQNVSWTSSNTSVATVNNMGIVTAVAPGTATITVKTADGNKTATCTVTVSNPTVAVTGVSLNKTSVTLTEDETTTLSATVAPSNATNKNVSWTSSDASVATVSAAGVVTAKAPGSATITVKTADGNKTATCTVTVNAKTVAVDGVSLNKATTELTVGSNTTLVATVTPENATNKAVTWASSNPAVATVSASGKVTALAAGKTTISVTTTDGNETATCVVTVKEAAQEEVHVTDVSLNKTSASLKVGEYTNLTATVTPADATNKAVTFTTSNATVATVSADGKVTAVGKGSATITVLTEDGSKTATCTVTVTDPSGDKVNSVTTDITNLPAANSITLADKDQVESAKAAYDALTADEKAKVPADTVQKLNDAVTALNNVVKAAEEKAADIESKVADIPVINPNEVPSIEVQQKINDAKAKFDALTKEEQALVDPAIVEALNAAVTAMNQAIEAQNTADTNAAKAVETVIIALPAADQITLADKTAVAEARIAYDKLTEAQKAKVDPDVLQKLTAAEIAIKVAEAESDAVKKAADAIGDIEPYNPPAQYDPSKDDADLKKLAEQIAAAEAELKNLTEAQKQQLTEELKKLEEAKNALAQAQAAKAAADGKAVESVAALIEQLPAEITPENKDAVAKAEEAYKKLTDDQKEMLGEEATKKLTDAVEAAKKVTTDEAAEVAKDIQNLPNPSDVKPEDKDNIQSVVTDFEKLTDEQKALIDSELLKKLEDVIKALEKATGEPVTRGTLKYNEETGLWEYIVDGKVDYDTYGFIDYEGYKFIVANGSVAPVSGLVMDPNSDLWYFCAEGQAVKHTGLVMYNEEWFFVRDGILDTKLNALVPYNGGLFYVAAGRLTREVSGLVLDPQSPHWYFVALGEVQNQYTGLATYNGAWFYVIKGKLADDYTGVVTYDNQLFNVVNGMVY